MRSANLLQTLRGLLQADTPPYHSQAAFELLYRQTYAQVFRYLYGFSGGSLRDAEDLTAETYLRAWRSRDSFKGDSRNAINWLLRIARNLTIDEHRRVKPPVTDMVDPDLMAGSDCHSPENAFEHKADRQVLREQLKNLPFEAREVLILRYTLGWPVKQIGAYLEKTENNISVIIHRSLATLQRGWQQKEEE